MELKVEDRLILSCVKIQPGATELEQINNLIPLIQDWETLTKNIIERGIGPLLYKKLPLLTNSSFMPERVKTKLQQVYYKTFSRSTILYEHFRKIAEAFTSHNIPLIALKGVYLSEQLYQDIGLRQFSDIDLLVKEEDTSTCLTILAEMGYKPSVSAKLSEIVETQIQSDKVHYPPMILEEVSIEIHIKLHQDKEKYNVKVDELWKNAIPATINGIEIYALNNYDLLIHLCLHLDKHFRGGHVQFTCFNDITNLLDRCVATINWNNLTEACRNYNCGNVVFEYIVLVNKYMNVPVPTEIIQQYDSLLTPNDEKLFFEYLNGNFGKFSAVPQHIRNLKNLKALSEKFRYIWEIVFPPKAFMIIRYGLANSRQAVVGSPVNSGCSDSRNVEILHRKLHRQSVVDSGQNYKLQTNVLVVLVSVPVLYWSKGGVNYLFRK